MAAAHLAVLYVAFALLKHVLPLPTLVRLACASKAPRPGANAESRAVALVARIRRSLGGGQDCLHGSLILYRQLLRAGASPRLCIGVRKNGARLEGHSWVEVRGEVVGEHPANGLPWSIVAAYGPDGRREINAEVSPR